MNQNHQTASCPCVSATPADSQSEIRSQVEDITPLSHTCGCEKMKICKISGDRRMCARMAQLGFIPGSEIEVVCPRQASKTCLVRIKGSTVTLDEMQAQNIHVMPA